MMRNPNFSIKVIVNICTYKRPKMLHACLTSILTQSIPAQWQVEIQIIDNDVQSDINSKLSEWAFSQQIPIHYKIEPVRGIPMARNTACQSSLNHQADWIIFIDDDETAKEGWLEAYATAINSNEAEVYTGPVEYHFPNDSAEWLANENFDRTPNGKLLKRAATNNVMIARKVFASDGMNMRFDEKMALMGGEDSDFFMRYVAQNGKIIFVKNAIVSEDVMLNRTTLQWRLNRQFRSSIHRIYSYHKLYGYKYTLCAALKQSVRHLIDGTIGLVTSPLFLLNSKNSFKRHFYHALRHYAKLLGNLTGLVCHNFEGYKITDGF